MRGALALPVQETVDNVKRIVGGWWSRKARPRIGLIERKQQHLKNKETGGVQTVPMPPQHQWAICPPARHAEPDGHAERSEDGKANGLQRD